MKSLTRISLCGAMAMLALSTGCSDGQSLSEKQPTQWKTCSALFGRKNMESLRSILDSDDLKFSNRALSVDQLKKGLTQEAIDPYDKLRGFKEYETCGLSGNGYFAATARWAADSLKSVQTNTERWQRANAEVYVADPSGVGGDVDLVFRCAIRGASGQAQVLLEARVSAPDTPRVSEAFHQQLAVKLARTLRDELACTNEPNIPDNLDVHG
ncbi:hypothetical protein [Streptomyces massasporeus]|uniref:hypothetical protein n=1 Tax=Streptomyces massasporeus TaxID=67324 RepID=UPI00365A5202